jgi:cytoskeletal protein CcmA (bactofilin family)
MWKKTDEQSEPVNNPVSSPTSHRQPVGEQAVIGPSLIVKGDVQGEEDLVIQGQVEGKVVLKKNSITVGKNGRVKADLYGKVIVVEGNLQGNLFGEEKIVVRKSGDIKGNLMAPRINLEEGARFKGSIDMEGSEAADKQRPLPGASTETKGTPAGKADSQAKSASTAK